MRKTMKCGLLVLLLATFSVAALAEDREDPQAAQTKPPLRTELVKLKYLQAYEAQSILRAYATPPGGIMLSKGPERIIIIKETPEMVEKMLSLIKELDVKPVEVELTVQLVQGSDTEGDNPVREDPVIRDLRNILRYKTYSHLDATVLRSIDGQDASSRIGPQGTYEIYVKPHYTKDGAAETIALEVRFTRPTWITSSTVSSDKKEETKSNSLAKIGLIETTLTLKAGEKTVVGVSKSDSDKGLILIISGKAVK